MTVPPSPADPPVARLEPFDKCPTCRHVGWAHRDDPVNPDGNEHCIGKNCRCTTPGTGGRL